VSGTKVSNNVAMLFINLFNLSLFNRVFCDDDRMFVNPYGTTPKTHVELAG
jgi:hypothetical protein